MGSTSVGLLVVLCPTTSMLTASWMMFFVWHNVSHGIELLVQSFCAGLVLAATASELFPLVPTSDPFGLSIGFLFGLGSIYLCAMVDTLFQDVEESEGSAEIRSSVVPGDPSSSLLRYTAIGTSDSMGYELKSASSRRTDATASRSPKSDDAHANGAVGIADSPSPLPSIEDEFFLLEVLDNNKPGRLEIISQRLDTLAALVRQMVTKAQALLASPGVLLAEDSAAYASMANVELEESLCEGIDEDIHKLQYCIDHCRRLLQGSGLGGSHAASIDRSVRQLKPEGFMSKRRKVHLQRSISDLAGMSSELANKIASSSPLSLQNSRELLRVLLQMESCLEGVHNTVDRAFLRFRFRWRRATVPYLPRGSPLPLSLIVPVLVDCFVDGFMIGIATSLSIHAGFILGIATSLEMGFLGAAFSIRVRKCTGSSLYTRYVAITTPPLLLFSACGIGSLAWAAASHSRVLLGLFLGFAISNLLQLSCVELLAEACLHTHAASKVAIAFAAGNWTVLMLELATK